MRLKICKKICLKKVNVIENEKPNFNEDSTKVNIRQELAFLLRHS